MLALFSSATSNGFEQNLRPRIENEEKEKRYMRKRHNIVHLHEVKCANLVRVHLGIVSEISPRVDISLFVVGLFCLNYGRIMSPMHYVFRTKYLKETRNQEFGEYFYLDLVPTAEGKRNLTPVLE